MCCIIFISFSLSIIYSRSTYTSQATSIYSSDYSICYRYLSCVICISSHVSQCAATIDICDSTINYIHRGVSRDISLVTTTKEGSYR